MFILFSFGVRAHACFLFCLSGAQLSENELLTDPGASLLIGLAAQQAAEMLLSPPISELAL